MMRPLSLALVALGAIACGDSGITPEGGRGGAGASGGSDVRGGAGGLGGAGGSGGSSNSMGGGEPCPVGVTCVETFPFTDTRDTSVEGDMAIDAYDCAPDTDEGGPEIVYRVHIPTDGFLSAAVYDDAGTDIDVQILGSFDPVMPAGSNCVDRGDHHARADVHPGYVWIIADTWVSASSGALTGSYKLDIGFIPVPSGPCGVETGEMARVGDGGTHLAMPATGPVVREAHLVTQAEPAPFPSTPTDQLAEHYALSQATTGLVMFREEVWAPLEGGDFYGAGIGDPALFPVLAEGWYVNMYWTPEARPARGTRMIFRLPDDPSRAVVVAAGYETGPGDLSEIAGTPEETHFYLGTDHESVMTLGIATDQSLPLGPRRCTD
ncbi:MAG: hypothetical protein U0271_16585 [Polyangiaceae bacterium]